MVPVPRAEPGYGWSGTLPAMHRTAAVLVLASLLAVARAGGDEKPAAPAQPAPPPLDLVASIPMPGVKGRLDHMALDAKRNRLIVAALGNGTVEALSLEKKECERSIGDLEAPQGVAYLPDLDRVVVTCGGDGSVRFYRGETLDLAAKVELSADADNVRYDAATQKVYVGFGDGAIAAINAKTQTLLAKTDVGAHPESLQLEPGGRRIFVNVAGKGEVVVVDRFEMTSRARWKLGDASENFPMAFDELGKRLFVGCRTPPSVVVLDTESGKIVTKAECSGDPDDISLDAKRSRLYVTCGAGTIDVFDREGSDGLKLRTKIETRRGARTSLFDADSDRLFVAVPKDGEHPAEVRIYVPR